MDSGDSDAICVRAMGLDTVEEFGRNSDVTWRAKTLPPHAHRGPHIGSSTDSSPLPVRNLDTYLELRLTAWPPRAASATQDPFYAKRDRSPLRELLQFMLRSGSP